MNDQNELILEELKKISRWSEHQRKVSKWAIIIALVTVPIIFGGATFIDHYFKKTISDIENSSCEKISWYDVNRYMRQGDIDVAISKATELIDMMPNYPEGHTTLGVLYLTSGNLEKAEAHFRRAYELFPSNENKENLDAILLRIKGLPQQQL